MERTTVLVPSIFLSSQIGSVLTLAKGKYNSSRIHEIVLVISASKRVTKPSHEVVDLSWSNLNHVVYWNIESDPRLQCESFGGW